MKNILFFIGMLVCQNVLADEFSVGGSSGKNYNSRSYSYDHYFNETLNLGVNYTEDALAQDYNFTEFSLKKYFNNGDSLSGIFSSDFSKDYSKTSSVGFLYKKFLSLNEEGSLMPSLRVGADFLKMHYYIDNSEDVGSAFLIGGGFSVGSLFEISASLKNYSYRSERFAQEKARRTARYNPAFFLLRDLPKKYLSGDVSFFLGDTWTFYYVCSTTTDLERHQTGSRLAGLSWQIIDAFGTDITIEESGRNTYQSLSFVLSF